MPKPKNSFVDRLSLKQKGLIIVCVPLVFQLMMGAILSFVYSRAEHEAWRESQARLLMIQANQIVKDMYSAAQTLFLIGGLKNEMLYAKWQEERQSLIMDLDSLRRITRGRSSQAYQKLLNINNKAISLLDDCYVKVQSGQSYSSLDAIPAIKSFADSFWKEVDLVLTQDLKAQLLGVLSEEQTRKLLIACLYGGLLFGVLIAFSLSLFFSSSMERRIGIITDNTKRLRNKETLNEQIGGNDEISLLDGEFHNLVKQLSDAERFRSEFISMLTHDLRTPLMSVELSVETIARGMENASARDKKELEAIKINLRRVMSLIRDLLDIERGSQGKLPLELEELDLAAILEKSIKSVSTLAGNKNLEIIKKYETDLVLMADKKRIEQVVVNLISNAIKYAPENSQIEIHAALKSSDKIEVRIIDRGSGVKPEDRARLFQRFERSSSPAHAEQSIGLGLAICKTIIESHHGDIGHEDNSAGGSIFWFSLPLLSDL